MTIYIYDKDDFDNGIYTHVDEYAGDDNDDCERWAAENYGDCDIYAWSYTAPVNT